MYNCQTLSFSVQPHDDFSRCGRVEFKQVSWSCPKSLRDRFQTGAGVALLAGLDVGYCPDCQIRPRCKLFHLHPAEFPPLPDVHERLLIDALHFVESEIYAADQ